MSTNRQEPANSAGGANPYRPVQALKERLQAIRTCLQASGTPKQNGVDDLATLFALRAICAGRVDQPDPWITAQTKKRWGSMLESSGRDRVRHFNELISFLATNAELPVSRCFRGYAPNAAPDVMAYSIALADQVTFDGIHDTIIARIYEEVIESDSVDLVSRNHLVHTPASIAHTLARVANIGPDERVVVQESGPGNLFGAVLRTTASLRGNSALESGQMFGIIDRASNQRIAAIFTLLLESRAISGVLRPRSQSAQNSSVNTNVMVADLSGPNPLVEAASMITPGGRGAMVVDDTALSLDAAIHGELDHFLSLCEPTVLLRLPIGAFHIRRKRRTLLLFNKRPQVSVARAGPGPWCFDLRSNMPDFGRENPFPIQAFKTFEMSFEGGQLVEARATRSGRWTRISSTSLLLGRLG